MGFFSILLLTLFLTKVRGNFSSDKDEKKNWEMCQKMMERPDFSPELVLGPAWITYYSWNVNYQNSCRQIRFENSTTQIVKRFRQEMEDFLVEQPNWESASLYVTKSSQLSGDGLLLFAEAGPPGKYSAVLNFLRTNSMSPPMGSLPLLHFVLKLIQGGEYLLMMDCLTGTTTLSTRVGHIPYRSQISSVAQELNIGEGLQACMRNQRDDERFLLGEDTV